MTITDYSQIDAVVVVIKSDKHYIIHTTTHIFVFIMKCKAVIRINM